jgi:hypothetical protein
VDSLTFRLQTSSRNSVNHFVKGQAGVGGKSTSWHISLPLICLMQETLEMSGCPSRSASFSHSLPPLTHGRVFVTRIQSGPDHPDGCTVTPEDACLPLDPPSRPAHLSYAASVWIARTRAASIFWHVAFIFVRPVLLSSHPCTPRRSCRTSLVPMMHGRSPGKIRLSPPPLHIPLGTGRVVRLSCRMS